MGGTTAGNELGAGEEMQGCIPCRDCRDVFLPVATCGPGVCAVSTLGSLCWEHCVLSLDQTRRAILR